MKNYFLKTVFLIAIVFSGMSLMAQEKDADSTGLPGDNFDLQGALAMFQKANSVEEFEKLINVEDNM